MLSVTDLLDAGTLDLDLAAFLMARISRGASFMVGANPGGAGKTTVMCALLNLIPPDAPIVAATSAEVRRPARGARCYVCHEIGAGPYFAYLWDRDLRAYCALAERGHTLATNLHADDLDEARQQVCGDNRVPDAHFNRFAIVAFLRVRGGYRDARRWIDKVYVSDDGGPHVLAFDSQGGLNREAARADGEREKCCREFLADCHERGLRTIEEVRTAVVGFLNGR
jgi:hypothetical protein